VKLREVAFLFEDAFIAAVEGRRAAALIEGPRCGFRGDVRIALTGGGLIEPDGGRTASMNVDIGVSSGTVRGKGVGV